ncbi:Pr6Pr family membrane protein [Nocardioides baculatus]|uniref:Pr6Pr family membrane protein n=1 Tax=Nocardioides baculatus TaxID=2801337 RepID=A0ABS1L470_9ACTN|nr:Pr6Pr family membrane protein [Nocardioides baculatus]MBL0746490.1 Pr6Pr family membrane protein [Nocardioides baculatus]
MTATRARQVHVVVAVVAWIALLLQLALVVKGTVILDETDPPALPLRLARYFAYFTIQSNILVAVTSSLLARDPERDGRGFRVARLAALVGITVTGLVHFFLLRPLLDLDGADWVADKLLHMVVPVLAVAAWALVGPRPRADLRVAAYALVWPVVWLVLTLIVGRLSGWVPYPFLDPDEGGWGAVGIACAGITILFLLLFALYAWLDRRLRPVPRGVGR